MLHGIDNEEAFLETYELKLASDDDVQEEKTEVSDCEETLNPGANNVC